ncbi:dipeptidase [Streptomyces sp. V1I1]|uniref:dipeptidase n=1 Tax=Streptomyces sp. V1I1 TaxID=3042272 RepID=UPI0027801675|nr:dipeptidase [Streptomyces sp. V1I1]MDQ0942988.1 microsomal dipeptidase-like Zn-dependent dipeptidase [Streptomyces sp. V1I1]
MADLQDEPQTATAAVGNFGDFGALDDLGDLDSLALPRAGASAEPVEPVEPVAGSLERARELLAVHPIADGFSGLAQALRGTPSHDIEHGERTLETDIPRLRDGGVGAQFWSLHAPSEITGDGALTVTMEQLDLVRSLVAGYPESMRLALSVDDLADARNCGRIAVLLGPVAGPALGDSLGTLRAYHALGVRSLTLAGTRWTQRTGLTSFGHEVVREMNRLGIVVDLSGCTPETMHRALKVAQAPVVISHHPERVPDDVLRQLRANRGVCMVPCTAATLRETADHLDHVRDAVGPESVALTGAYDTGAQHAPDLADVSCFPRLIAELLDRSWPEPDIEALTWGNVYRVVRDTDFVARAMQDRRSASTARVTTLDDA